MLSKYSKGFTRCSSFQEVSRGTEAAGAESTADTQGFAHQLQEQFTLSPSAKHLAHRELGHLELTASLKYRAAAKPGGEPACFSPLCHHNGFSDA